MDVRNFMFSSRKVPNMINISEVEKYDQTTCDCAQPRGHSIRVFYRKGALVTVEICVLCGR